MNWKSTTISWALVFSLGFLVTACGGESLDINPFQLNGVSYTLVDETTLKHDSSSISGSGSIIVISPVSGTSSKDSYSLEFTLADGGSLTLVTHSNEQLKDGLNLTFSRKGQSLTGVTQVGNTSSASFSLSDIDNASGKIELQIDVHNNESPAHVLIWTGSNFAEASAIYNSESPGPNSPGNGAGTLWGLILSNATVTSFNVGSPKFNESP